MLAKILILICVSVLVLFFAQIFLSFLHRARKNTRRNVQRWKKETLLGEKVFTIEHVVTTSVDGQETYCEIIPESFIQLDPEVISWLEDERKNYYNNN